MKITITRNTDRGAMYAGVTVDNSEDLLPAGSTILGTVRRDSAEAGALLQLRTGQHVQYNAGVIRSLPPSVNRASIIRAGFQYPIILGKMYWGMA